MVKNFQKTVLKNILHINFKNKCCFGRWGHRPREKNCKANNPEVLKAFMVNATDRKYNFWLRDPLAIRVFSGGMASQKLDYMHNIPLQEHWRLCQLPEAYRFSSAPFYENKIDEFKILTPYMEVFYRSGRWDTDQGYKSTRGRVIFL